MAEGDVVNVPPSEDTAEEAQLRAALEKADNEASREVAGDRLPELESEESAQESGDRTTDEGKDQSKSDSSEASAESKASDRDEKGRFKPKGDKAGDQKPAGETKPNEQSAGDQKPQTKEEKEASRLAKSWQQLEAEKAEIRQIKADLIKIREQVSKQPNQSTGRFSSKEYLAAADEFERQAADLMENLDVEGARAKLDLAKQARHAATQFGQQEQTETQKAEAETFDKTWRDHMESAIKENPELADRSSEAGQAMAALLQELPILGSIPDGFKRGVELLKLRRDAAQASELRTKVEKLEKENKELRAKTSISGGGLTGKVGTKNFDDMTLEEQEAYLERAARAEDSARVT
jgi:hypothetical protein